MSLLERARNSEFKKLVNGDLSVANAVIIWTNFAGKPTKYVVNGGKRTFALVLTEKVAKDLKADGWNVKMREGREEGDDPLWFTEIVINMESKFPPKVVLYTDYRGKKSGNRLNEHTIKQLDYIDIENIDAVIHPYEHGFSAVATIKGYANALYVTQAKDENFGGKYEDYEVNESAGFPDEDDDDLPF